MMACARSIICRNIATSGQYNDVLMNHIKFAIRNNDNYLRSTPKIVVAMSDEEILKDNSQNLKTVRNLNVNSTKPSSTLMSVVYGFAYSFLATSSSS